MKEFRRKIYAICAHTLKNFARPVMYLKISNNVSFKGAPNYLPGWGAHMYWASPGRRIISVTEILDILCHLRLNKTGSVHIT
jgi:hypothetical protein